MMAFLRDVGELKQKSASLPASDGSRHKHVRDTAASVIEGALGHLDHISSAILPKLFSHVANQAAAKGADAAEGYFAGDGSDIPTFIREVKVQGCSKTSASASEDPDLPGRSSSPQVCGLPFHIRTRLIYAADCCIALAVFRVDEDDDDHDEETRLGVDDFICLFEKLLSFRSQVADESKAKVGKDHADATSEAQKKMIHELGAMCLYKCSVLGKRLFGQASSCDMRQLNKMGSLLTQLKHGLAGQPPSETLDQLTKDIGEWEKLVAAGLEEGTKKSVIDSESVLTAEEASCQVKWNSQIGSVKQVIKGMWPLMERLKEASLELVQKEFKAIDQVKLAQAYKDMAEIQAQAKNIPEEKLQLLFPAFPAPVMAGLESMVHETKAMLGCQSGLKIIASEKADKAKEFEEKLHARDLSMSDLPTSVRDALEFLAKKNSGNSEDAQ